MIYWNIWLKSNAVQAASNEYFINTERVQTGYLTLKAKDTEMVQIIKMKKKDVPDVN